jgi:predicted O-methyltransferase YrrM
MTNEVWDSVDRYFGDLLLPSDPALPAALQASDTAGLPEIAVSPTQGAFLAVMARAIGARKILEVGTLGGYSTIWLGRMLPPDGKIISLEVHPIHAKVARQNIANAGLAAIAEVRRGKGLDLLPKIAEANEGPFDLVFIDADKENNAAYFDWAVKLTRPGSLIIVDNVVRGGLVVNPSSTDPSVRGVRVLADHIANEKRVSATVVQTVGSKGYDGLAIAVVL